MPEALLLARELCGLRTLASSTVGLATFLSIVASTAEKELNREDERASLSHPGNRQDGRLSLSSARATPLLTYTFPELLTVPSRPPLCDFHFRTHTEKDILLNFFIVKTQFPRFI